MLKPGLHSQARVLRSSAKAGSVSAHRFQHASQSLTSPGAPAPVLPSGQSQNRQAHVVRFKAQGSDEFVESEKGITTTPDKTEDPKVGTQQDQGKEDGTGKLPEQFKTREPPHAAPSSITQPGKAAPSDGASKPQQAEAKAAPSSSSASDLKAMISTATQLYEEVWSSGRVTLLEGLMAEDHEQHDMVWQPTRVGLGRRSMKRGILAYRTLYPDLKFKVQDTGVGSDGSSIFVRWSAMGTHLGEVRGHPPTGKKAEFAGLSQLHFDQQGRIKKSWVFRQAPEDEVEHFLQIGQTPFGKPFTVDVSKANADGKASPAVEDDGSGGASGIGSRDESNDSSATEAKAGEEGATSTKVELRQIDEQGGRSDVAGAVSSFFKSRQNQTADDAGAESSAPDSKEKAATKLIIALHGKRADDPDVRAAVMKMREDKHEVTVSVTWAEGDVERFVRQALQEGGYHTVVAAGGDGTVTEVVEAIMKLDAADKLAIGVLPLGTSNDFAGQLGLPSTAAGALELCEDGSQVRPVDVGLLNGKVWMNTATLGAISEISGETSHEAKSMMGPLAYLVTGVQRLTAGEYQPVMSTLRYPSEGEDPYAPRDKQKVTEVRVPLLNLTAGNSRQLASMVQICPDALLDDGLLDITYTMGTPGEQAAAIASAVLQEGLEGKGTDLIKVLRVPWIEIIADEAISANRDGEDVEPTDKYVLEALYRRVRMHLPESDLLVSSAHRGNEPVISHHGKRAGFLRDMLSVTKYQRMKEDEAAAAAEQENIPHGWKEGDGFEDFGKWWNNLHFGPGGGEQSAAASKDAEGGEQKQGGGLLAGLLNGLGNSSSDEEDKDAKKQDAPAQANEKIDKAAQAALGNSSKSSVKEGVQGQEEDGDCAEALSKSKLAQGSSSSSSNGNGTVAAKDEKKASSNGIVAAKDEKKEQKKEEKKEEEEVEVTAHGSVEDLKEVAQKAEPLVDGSWIG